MKYDDPLALFRDAVDALNRGDWLAAAALCDPLSLRSFRRSLLLEIAPSEPPRSLTVDDFVRHTPDMPREVAEYQVEQSRKFMAPMRRLRENLPGVRSVEEAEAMSPEELFAGWLDGRSPWRQIERLAAEGRIPAATVAQARAYPLPVHRYEVLGVVHDGDRIAHVVYRHANAPDAPDEEAHEAWLAEQPEEERELARDLAWRAPPQVVTCRRQPDGSWRLLAGWDFLHLGSSAIVGFAQAEDGEAPDPDAQ
ncbi:MAG TPA: hypothetical protein VFS05_07240 [Gemmatimonadaceae bacterium]|nr:hypothetical protein [Gemmatimonadaceae bacterium]